MASYYSAASRAASHWLYIDRNDEAQRVSRDPQMCGLTVLALAVITQAIQDATVDIEEPSLTADDFFLLRWQRALRHRDEARYFLTTANGMLEFWCRLAGFNMWTVLRYSKAAGTDWEGLGRLHRLHQLGHLRGAAWRERRQAKATLDTDNTALA